MMEMTLEQLKTIVEEMERENVTSVSLDFSCSNDCVDEFDVDIWKSNFVKTILTISKE